MVLDLANFRKHPSISFGKVFCSKLSPLWSELNFCKQILEYGCYTFFSISKFKMAENKIKYILKEYLPKVVWKF